MGQEEKFVFAFEEGRADMKYVLGGKGANLAEMTSLGLPVPPGFTITTAACNSYSQTGDYPAGLNEQIQDNLAALEGKTGKKLGDEMDPLLVSVRSGAAFSMPGMMDTVLNLGLNDRSVEGLIEQTGDARFAYDSYRRFIQMFGKVVMHVEGELFEQAIRSLKESRGVKQDLDLTADDLRELIVEFQQIVKEHGDRPFPQDPKEQLDLAVKAVFESWNNKRAKDYRRLYKIADDLGTAVNIQTMVFGNKGDTSGTGVAFTRDAATGENVTYGDYLMNAQGEDVVAGIRHTEPIANLKNDMPEAYDELMRALDILEKHYRDMCDTEFTIEQRKLYMLQTRVGKRTAAAALRIAVDMVKEGLISKEEAVMRIAPEQLDQLLHPRFDPEAEVKVLTTGLNASPGAAVGKVVFDADKAEELGERGEKVILTRWETTPDDLHGMIAAQGILTSHGGKTSHAAVVARGMGKPCVAGAAELNIDMIHGVFSVDGQSVNEGQVISIDGTTGRVVVGEVPLVPPTPTPEFKTILDWADEIRRLGVRSNADTPEDAAKAREFGAEGIGLARTEHMFLGDRLPIVQQMILGSEAEKKAALDQLLAVQKKDFAGILKAMDGLPVTIRLLDPPLHEFLPSRIELEVEVAKLECQAADQATVDSKRALLHRVQTMSEANPMLGLRGCRLGIMEPDLYKMQVRAIMEAAVELKAQGADPRVEIMIPLVSLQRELTVLRGEVEAECKDVIEKSGQSVDYMIGTMIELPRAAVTANEIAQDAEFFSFGTNDLTQTTFGFSRDDIEGKFLSRYLERKIMDNNPFEILDPGVGELIRTACRLGRETNPKLKLGVCGEHGGEPNSVNFFHQVGLDYVSCSPYRVPLARLAAAQAVLSEKVGAGGTA
jgi:pyruvate, orthophosphate dikinase